MNNKACAQIPSPLFLSCFLSLSHRYFRIHAGVALLHPSVRPSVRRSGALRKSISLARLIRRWLLPGHILIKISASRYILLSSASTRPTAVSPAPFRRAMNPVSLVNVRSHRVSLTLALSLPLLPSSSPSLLSLFLFLVPRYFLFTGKDGIWSDEEATTWNLSARLNAISTSAAAAVARYWVDRIAGDLYSRRK